ncbi:MAG: hypothetical protein RI983_186 [Bacteroidota bacterium]
MTMCRFANIIFTMLLLVGKVTAQKNPVPIGQWREHLNYQTTFQVVKGDKLYAATDAAVFSVDKDSEISRYTKINRLTDIGVQQIAWDELNQQLIVAYKNSNLDFLKNDLTKNVSDIQKSSIAGDKRINAIYCANGNAYLSTGLGIIVVNTVKYEIRDTWIIGNNGNQVKINAFCEDSRQYYAATAEGLKSILKSNTNPANFQNWTTLPTPFSGNITFVGTLNNHLFITQRDSVFIQENNQWKILYQETGWNILNTSLTENQISLCLRTSSGNSKVVLINKEGGIEKSLAEPGVISLPGAAIRADGKIWVADQFGGLSSFGSSNSTIERFIPNGPNGIPSGDIYINNGRLLQGTGAVNNAWNYLYKREGYIEYAEGIWKNTGAINTPILDTVLDIITITSNPVDQTIWAGSYGGGLIRKKGNEIQILKQNSGLEAAIGDPGNYRISGLALDNQQNLWISNYGASKPLKLLSKNNEWAGFSTPLPLVENALAQIISDDENSQLWIQSPKGNGLLVYYYGNNILTAADDRWKLFKQGAGNGNLPSNNVLSLAKDRDNTIWVGTDDGIGIIQCTDNPFSNCDAILPVIQQDQFAGFLFKAQQVQSIAVDGANRKWIGTQNGVWLISPDGKNIIHHFTETNSPLLSNDVKKIGIDPQTGEVYFATFNGLCSYRSTATASMQQLESVLVFPNPVPPQYNGQIAIRGLTENAIVKITELNGRMVYQTRSLGGQAVWNGLDYNGRKIASGIYLVLVKDDKGKENIATKIIITSGR